MRNKILYFLIIIIMFIALGFSKKHLSDFLKTTFGWCSVAETLRKKDVYENEVHEYSMEERDAFGLSTHGAIYRIYKKDKEIKIVEVVRLISLGRFFTTYFIDNGRIFYIEEITDEWDLKKLYGEHADLPDAERRYVVATSTREGYVIAGDKLCVYIADRPSAASVAVTASDPQEDSRQLLEIFQEIKIAD